jgi:uncharacterized protein
MRTSISIFLLVLFTTMASAQVVSWAEHKIIFQLTDGDQEVHKKFIRQLNNVLTAAPNAKIEVVTHGMGIDLLHKTDNPFEMDLQKLTDKGVVFVICENTLKQREMKKEQFLPLAGFVPAAILELVMKQESGWIYIKSGG